MKNTRISKNNTSSTLPMFIGSRLTSKSSKKLNQNFNCSKKSKNLSQANLGQIKVIDTNNVKLQISNIQNINKSEKNLRPRNPDSCKSGSRRNNAKTPMNMEIITDLVPHLSGQGSNQ
jgi:hypothetical protein